MTTTTSPAHDGIFSRAYRTLTAGLLLGILLAAFEAMAVATVLPRVSDALNGLPLYGWAFSAFLLSNVVGTIVAGALIDHRGPTFTYAAGLTAFAAGLLTAAAAPTMTVFVLARLMQGLGAGAMGALPFAVINTAYPAALRARMIAAISSAWVIPALVGPLIASVIADHFSWRAVFWGLLPLMAATAPLTLAALHRHAPPGRRDAPTPTLAPAAMLAASAAAIIEGLRHPDPRWTIAAALGAIGAVAAARHLFPRGLFRARPGLPAALAVRGTAAFAFFGTEAFLPLGLTRLRGLTLTEAGLLLSIGGVTWALGSILQSRIEARYGAASRTARVRGGVVLITLGIVTAAAAVLTGVPAWLAHAGWLIAALGMGVGYSSNTLVTLSFATPDTAGRVSGQLASVEVLCQALATGAGGVLVARLDSGDLRPVLTAVFAVMAVVSLLPWVAATRLAPGSR